MSGGEIIAPGEATWAELEDRYALAFNAAWRRGVESIVESGRILAAAKAKLGHGQWSAWLATRTPVGERTAQKLMKIAGDPNIRRHLANPTHESDLPQDRETLVELCGLEEERFDALVQAGTIHPEMKRGDVRTALIVQCHADPPPLAALPAGKYRAILADPPWPFESWGSGQDRAPDLHYPTMTIADIQALDVAPLAADDCALFLWAQPPQFPEALGVMAAWGFEYRTTAFTWCKESMGLGYWTRRRSELCLLGVRGQPKRLSADVDEVIHAPRGRHSEKPEEMYGRIERLVPGPYVELFARSRREGWDTWGNDPEVNR